MEPTAEVLSWWHHRGIVRKMDDTELPDLSRRDQVRKTEEKAKNYWHDHIVWKISIAENLLQGGR